jgi:trans-aconitate 2-methyltransferase
MSNADQLPTYTFGHSATAAERLILLAQVYEPEIRAFLRQWAVKRPALAVDLGCGPGLTTRMLAEESGAPSTVGLDVSASFIEQARDPAPAGIDFAEHDVCLEPLPTGPVDLLFCHFLLTHLSDPPLVLETWSRQLRPRGRLLIDEVERIETSHPIFMRYLEIVSALVGHGGGVLEIGPLLDALPPPPGLERAASQIAELDVATSDAASLFRLNLEVWRHNPFINEHYSAAEIEHLAMELDELRRSMRQDDIRWQLRQIAYERPA